MVPKLVITLEASKSITEESLSSNYISQYSPVNVAYPVLWINKAPSSITDWIVEGTLSNIPYMNKLYGKCNTGDIKIEECSIHKLNNALENNYPLFNNIFGTSYDRTAKLDARFDSVDINVMYSYKYTGTEADKNTIRSAGIDIMEVSDETRDMKFEDERMSGTWTKVSGYSYQASIDTPPVNI